MPITPEFHIASSRDGVNPSIAVCRSAFHSRRLPARRDSLTGLFRSLGLRPLYLDAGFSAERVTRYFFGADDAA